jgi:signal transduction histidine kinase
VKENELKLRENQQQLRELAAHHEAIREEERARIARELHDELGQLLTGVKLHLSTHGSGGADRRVNQNYVAQLVEQAIGVTRNVVTDLRPPVFDQGFAAAVRWYADQFYERTGIACETDIAEGDFELDEARAMSLFRVLQESLTNVAKHAGATRVDIKLTASHGQFQLRIGDNGKGFRTEYVKTKRTFGLLGMRERVAMLGGDLTVASEPGKGTVVTVDILQERKAA